MAKRKREPKYYVMPRGARKVMDILLAGDVIRVEPFRVINGSYWPHGTRLNDFHSLVVGAVLKRMVTNGWLCVHEKELPRTRPGRYVMRVWEPTHLGVQIYFQELDWLSQQSHLVLLDAII